MIFGNFCVWSKCASSFFLLFFLFWSSFFSSFFFVRERERRTKHTVLISFFMVLRIAPYNTTKKKASFRALLFPQIETFHWSLLSVMHITFSLLHEQSSSLLLKRHHLVFASKRVVWSDDDDAFFVGGGRGGGRGVAKTHRAATRKRRTRGRRATFFRARCARFFRGGRIAVKESGHCGPLE